MMRAHHVVGALEIRMMNVCTWIRNNPFLPDHGKGVTRSEVITIILWVLRVQFQPWPVRCLIFSNYLHWVSRVSSLLCYAAKWMFPTGGSACVWKQCACVCPPFFLVVIFFSAQTFNLPTPTTIFKSPSKVSSQHTVNGSFGHQQHYANFVIVRIWWYAFISYFILACTKARMGIFMSCQLMHNMVAN